ncbi:MAG: glycosyltransferase family 2 protein [Candidatus Electrothrix sp. YB6]
MAELCIIIVNYNTDPLLIRCLDSIRRQKGIDRRVIVVDNASSDRSIELVRSGYPEVQLIANKQNLGFAAANNQAIAKTSEELLFFLNPDTELQPGCLAAACAFMTSHPEIGMTGSVILNRDGSVHNSVDQGYPGEHYSQGQFDDLPGDIAWLLGAALVARREAVASVQGFDERFFLYAEDIDLCLELRKQGWQLGLIPDAAVMHLEGQSEVSTPYAEVAQRKISSELLFLQKHYSKSTVTRICRRRRLQAWWRLLFLWPAAFSRNEAQQRKMIKYLTTARIYSHGTDRGADENCHSA